jgi:two-component system, response regulator PdtaR
MKLINTIALGVTLTLPVVAGLNIAHAQNQKIGSTAFRGCLTATTIANSVPTSRGTKMSSGTSRLNGSVNVGEPSTQTRNTDMAVNTMVSMAPIVGTVDRVTTRLISPTTVTAAEENESGASGRQPVVLLVEDEPMLCCTTAEVLRLSGYRVIETQTMVEAVAELTSGRTIDVVFSDVCLSGHLEGLVLARWLHERCPTVPVLLTSGYGDPVREAAVDLLGNDHFLSKPYRYKELAGRLRTLV